MEEERELGKGLKVQYSKGKTLVVELGGGGGNKDNIIFNLFS